jgi:hypothetical protein
MRISKLLALVAGWLMAAIAFAVPARSNGAATTFEAEEVDRKLTAEVQRAIADVWRAIQVAALGTRAPNNPFTGGQLLHRVDITDTTDREITDRTNQIPGSAGITGQLNMRSALV